MHRRFLILVSVVKKLNNKQNHKFLKVISLPAGVLRGTVLAALPDPPHWAKW